MLSNQRTLLLWSILILFVFQVGLIFLLLNKFNSFDSSAVSSIIFQEETDYVSLESYSLSADFYNEAYEQSDENFIYSDKVLAGILPHHLIVKGKIANFFSGLQKQNIETVVLISPNHFEKGSANIILTQAKWQTPFGDLLPDIKLAKRLAEQEGLLIDEKALANEHGISGLVPFIKKSLPQAKIVPIILKNKTSATEISQLADNLNKYLGSDTLVLASVDFSHYQPALVADFHDDKSSAVISNLAFEQTQNLEIDSPASLAVLLRYAQLRGVEQANLLWQTNSSRLLNQLDMPGTSHQFYYFTKGEKKVNQVANFLFFGDMMLDRNVGAKIASHGLEPLLDTLAGEEKRFFMGSDMIATNLEGAVTNDGNHYPPVAGNDFAFAPEVVAKLKNYNFNFFNLANNHLTDQGAKGVEETRNNLTALDLNFSGCVDAQIGGCSGKVVEINGAKVAMLGLSMVYNSFDVALAQNLIADFKKQTDLVIVNIHWGAEYEHQYNTKQTAVAHALIDSGADVIVGHHPHVAQGLEFYKDKPIFYSLGNFIFDQYFSTDTQEGLALGMSIDLGTKKGSIYLFPLKSHVSQSELMVGEDKRKFLENFVSWSNFLPERNLEILVGKINLSLSAD